MVLRMASSPRAKTQPPQGGSSLSNARLQGSNWERLHDLPGWLRLHHDHLAENLPLPSLGGGLHARLDPAQTRECEKASALYFFRANLCNAAQHFRNHCLFQLALSRHSFCEGTL